MAEGVESVVESPGESLVESLGRLVALALTDAAHAQHPELLALRGLLREVGDATAATDGQP